jgi:hypothetical protein
MQGSSYFRRQAETCMRLSASCTDQSWANRFRAMAEDLMAKASDAEVGDESGMLPASLHAQARRAVKS